MFTPFSMPPLWPLPLPFPFPFDLPSLESLPSPFPSVILRHFGSLAAKRKDTNWNGVLHTMTGFYQMKFSAWQCLRGAKHMDQPSLEWLEPCFIARNRVWPRVPNLLRAVVSGPWLMDDAARPRETCCLQKSNRKKTRKYDDTKKIMINIYIHINIQIYIQKFRYMFDAWLRVYILPHHCLFSGLWDPDSIWFKHMSCVMTPVRSVSAREIRQQRHFAIQSSHATIDQTSHLQLTF